MCASGYEPPALRQDASTGDHDIESAQPSQHEQHATARSGGTNEGSPEHDISGQSSDTRWTRFCSGLSKAVSCRSKDALLSPMVLAQSSPYRRDFYTAACMASRWTVCLTKCSKLVADLGVFILLCTALESYHHANSMHGKQP